MSNNDFLINFFNISIVDNLNISREIPKVIDRNDGISDVKIGETKTGYIYFKDNYKNYTYFIYSSGMIDNQVNYTFKIK